MTDGTSSQQTRQLGTPLLLVTGIAGVGTAVVLFHTVGSVVHQMDPAFAGDGIPFEATFDGALLVAAFCEEQPGFRTRSSVIRAGVHVVLSQYSGRQ